MNCVVERIANAAYVELRSETNRAIHRNKLIIYKSEFESKIYEHLGRELWTYELEENILTFYKFS